MKFIISLLLAFSFYTVADDHGADADVLAAVNKYYAARNAEDFKTMVAMESNAGVCSTNSDGSFHKACAVETVEDYEQNYPDGLNNVYYPEATKISESVYLVRFYYEGVSGADSQPYRTRVTTTWVMENDKWVLRSQHYSPAAYGGVHQTVKSDFENE